MAFVRFVDTLILADSPGERIAQGNSRVAFPKQTGAGGCANPRSALLARRVAYSTRLLITITTIAAAATSSAASPIHGASNSTRLTGTR